MWTIYNDFHCHGDVGATTLSFTTCSEDQFTCNNGLCVGILDRYAMLANGGADKSLNIGPQV